MIKIAKESLLNTKIIVLVSKVNYDFAKNIDFIDDVILYEDDLFSLVKNIKKKKIDISISAFTDTKLACSLLLSGIKTRYAPATKIAQFFSNKRIRQRRSKVEKSEYEYNIDLLKHYNSEIKIYFDKELLKFTKLEKERELALFKSKFSLKGNFKYIAFHPGFGGSSDGNLTLDDYLNLAKSISHNSKIKVVFTFGPDDIKSKDYIKSRIDFDAILYSSDLPLIDFCKLLSSFYLLVSTSTGPMHLAGAVNIHTLSFFGDSLFASPKRWKTINEESKQHNFILPKNYNRSVYFGIEDMLKKLV